MKTITHSILLSLTLVLISCSTGNEVNVKFYPEGNVQRLSTFMIDFNKELAPPDKIDIWLDDEFIKFTPPITGKFKWLTSKSLLFTPEVLLEPIQEYKAEVTAKVLFNKPLTLDETEFKFRTADFDLLKVDYFWRRVPNEKNTLTVQANVHFNYPVNPDQLKNHLLITKQGKKITDFNIVSDKSAEIIAVNLGNIPQTLEKQELSIIVKSGLKSIYGKKPLHEDQAFRYELEPISKLAITNVYSGYEGKKGWIEVRTTQMVDKDKLEKFVTFEPDIEGRFYVTENSFRFEGDFINAASIKMVIKKGLPGLFGGKLEFDYEQLITMANVQPSINFTDKQGKYLMLTGQKNLQVDIVNIDKVDVEVSKVYKNNLLHFLNSHRYMYYNNRYNPNYHIGNFGDRLFSREMKLESSKNVVKKLDLNLDDLIGTKYKGIYIVKVNGASNRWLQDSKMLALSDLAVIAKKSNKEIVVFINSIEKGEPVPGAEVSVISNKNQELLKGVTDEQGVVKFENWNGLTNDQSPVLVTVEMNDDFNFIDFRETLIENSRFDVGGIPQYSQYYTAFIYGERNLYRPGETAHISGIVRDDKISVIDEIPLHVKILTPEGKTFREGKVVLNAQGSFDLNVQMPDYAQTGEYRLYLYANSTNLIGTYNYSLEEFVPDKIRVTLTKNKERVKAGDKIVVNADAEFLFGAKAAGLKYEAIIDLNHYSYKSSNYPKYIFSNSSAENTQFQSEFLEGVLDNNGHTEISYKTPQKITSSGIVKGAAFVSVFDLTGRTVSRATTFDINPKDYFIGIRSNGYYFNTGQEINYKFVAVDSNDTALKEFAAVIELYKLNWQTVLRRDESGRYYYVSEKEPVKISQQDITINGETDYSMTVEQSGRYELRLRKKDDTEYQHITFYAYNWRTSSSTSFQVDKEGRIDLVTDKEVYEPGESARLLFTAPFSGKMLITIERNGIYDYKYVDVDKKSVEVFIPIKESYMPNVYITATLFRPHSANNNAPFLVGHGFHSVKVEKLSNKLPVTIKAPEKIKSNTKQEITIETLPEKNIYITIAAVDEGILQIKNYKTPDPYAFMNAKRALEVASYDLYKLLLPEIISTSSSAGGMALERELKKRINPIKSKRFNLVSYWSGLKRTDSDGKVTVEFDVPQFNGELRLMAVAYHGSRFGSAEGFMKVSESVILEPEMPRVLTSNDKLLSNISVINTTDEEGTIDLSVSVEGPLDVTSESTKTIELEPNSTTQVLFEITARNDIGTAKIKFETSGMVKVTNEIEIGIRPASPLVVASGHGQIKAGDNIEIDLPDNYIHSSWKTALTLSRFPAIKYAGDLQYLLGYPHGCIEQTVSKLFPQLYFDELVKLIEPELYRTNNPSYYIKEGIRKIESMQLNNGSIAYWLGGSYSNWWGTVYAAHFLVEAKKAGFTVDSNVYNKLLDYIARSALEKKTYNYTTYRNNSRTLTKIAYKEIPYSLYVLALAGRGDLSTMNYYKNHPHLLSTDSKYLIAGAFAIMNQMTSYNEFLPDEFVPVKTDRLTGGNFDSEARANAIMLNVLLDINPNHEQIGPMVKHLAGLAKRMYSTQERSFTFLALGKAAKLSADADLEVNVYADAKLIKKVNDGNIHISNPEMNADKLILEATGSGMIYYFWDAEGIQKEGIIEETDSRMKVRRAYYDFNTKHKITDNRFEQGQLLVCKISLQGFETSAENIAITDMIPAGFEIENPRLSELNKLAFKTENRMNADNLDVRDDRILLFTDLKRNKTTEYTYMIRVVNSGEFILPPINAEAMYDREFRSVNGAGKVTISK